VLVTQASAGFVTSVTELVFGFMIDLARGVSRHADSYHSGKVPQAAMGRELRGSTLGVVGHGAIGREVVRVARALGMQVLICDPYVADAATVPLQKLLSESDFVVPLAVASAETENLMNDAAFSAMKQGAFFINVSRGNLVDEAALARALDSGRIAGCALDVGRAPDQMPTPALAARSDVIATPHTAGLTLPAIEHQSMETVAQVAGILKGHAPKGAVNVEHWTRKALLEK
jgi:D-3-phosphoglycerate dehydrogenase